MDTPTPFMKIGNDVFQGTPQRLIGSEIITKDTRGKQNIFARMEFRILTIGLTDPQNPIKHSHPAIGHTDYRISLEPVKLVPHPTDSAPEKSTERPPLFARDAPPESDTPVVTPVFSKTKRRTKGAIPAENAEEETGSPVASTSGQPATPASAVPPSKRKPAAATRASPLSTRYVIPASGEISADGIPRIDGQEVRKIRKARKMKQVVTAETETDGLAMDVDMPESVVNQATAGPSNSSNNENDIADVQEDVIAVVQENVIADVQDVRPPDLQRLFMPDAPRGYTKRGLPRKAPGRRPQPKKTVAQGSASPQINSGVAHAELAPDDSPSASTLTEGETADILKEGGAAPDRTTAMDVDSRNDGEAAVPGETTQEPPERSTDQ